MISNMELETSQLSNHLARNRTRKRMDLKCRIRCHGHKIQVGERQFISASEALQAYMDQYAGITTQGDMKYDGNVTNLLDPKSVLHMTADRSRQTGVNDTMVEMKLAQAKDTINFSHERMRKSTALRAEVEQALNKSGELLDRISRDELEPATVPSDLGSMATDLLISINPTAGYTDSKRSGHVYSYRTSRTRSRSLSRERPSIDTSAPAPYRELRRDNRPPSSYQTFTGGKPRERSRSVSPSSFRHNEQLLSNPVHSRNSGLTRMETRDCSRYKSPSWIEALDISNPSENLWSKRDLVSGRPPPSWIQGLEGSEVSSLVPGLPHEPTDINNLIGPPNFNSSSIRDTSITSNPPGLSYKDLMTTPTKGKSVNFDLSSHEFKHPASDKFNIASKLPKEVLNSGKQDLNSSDALEKYLEDLGCGNKPSTSALDSSYNAQDVPRSSSLDTEALLNGLSAPDKDDVAGASPAVKYGSRTGRSPLGGHRSRRRPQSPDTDLVLDGDRPWEKSLGSIKPPVFVDEMEPAGGDVSAESATLTGRSQPGSLETLKNMLFKLQAEAADGTNNNEKIAKLIADSRKELGSDAATQLEEEIPALKGYNYQDQPGGQSLERALVHLNRLKTLVENDKEARSRSPSRDRSLSPQRSMRSRSMSPLQALSKPILS